MWLLGGLFWMLHYSSLMEPIFMIAICLALTPRSFISSAPVQITEDFTTSQMESFFVNTMVNIYGQDISLQALYGGVMPRLEDFITDRKVFQRLATSTPRILRLPPSEFWIDCVRGDYVNRKLISNVPSTSSTDSEDTPTQIAHDLSSYVLNQRASTPITTIIGEPGTGKTTSLLKIQHELINLVHSCWVIIIDSSWQHLLESDVGSPAKIVNSFVNWNVRKLFRNLLKVNPKKIVLILDNIDRIAVEHMSRYVQFLKYYARKGVVIVTAGRRYNIDIFNDRAFPQTIYRIPELQIFEAKEMLYNIWSSMSGISHLSEDDRHVAWAHLNDYSTVFTHVLFKTPIPRQPHMLKAVATRLSTRETSLRMQFPTDYASYSIAPDPPLGRLRQALEANSHKQYYFESKKKLYEHLFTTDIHRQLTTVIPNYGSIAVHQIITENEDVLTANYLLEPVFTDVNYAKLALPHLRRENKFFTIIGGTVEFSHPEYERYIAMDYITTTLIHQLNSPDIMRLVLRFFINPKYKYLLEFAAGEDWSPLIDRIDNDENLFRLLDNIIGNGLDHLYRNIHERLIFNNQADRLQRYFLEDRVIPFGPHRALGMLQTGRSTDVFDFATEFIPNSSPIEALFRYDMAQAIHILHLSQIESNTNVNLHRLLYIAVTNPWPNLGLCIAVIHYINYRGRSNEFYLNALLFDVINQVGPGSEEIAIYLLSLGAKSTYITPSGQSLLHAAVRWSDAAFLKFVIEVLPVNPVEKSDNLGRTVFAAALDANPTPSFARPNWWQMMQYLVSTVNGLSLPPANLIVHNSDIFNIPVRDTKTPWMELMVGWRKLLLPVVAGVAHYNARDIQVTSVAQLDRRFQYYHTLAHAVPSHLWRLCPRTLELRLNFLLHSLYLETDRPSPVEVLMNYAGFTALSDLEHRFYRAAVNELYLRSAREMSMASYIRLVVALVNNVISGNDMISLIYVQTHPILQLLPEPLRTQLYNIIHEHFSSAEISHVQDNLSLRWALTHRKTFDVDRVNLMIILQQTRLPALPHFLIQDSSEEPTLCLPGRSRRSIAIPPICLYNWEDVDQFTSNGNRPALSSIQVDTDRLIAQLVAIESSDVDKGQQLVNLVDYLEKKAAPASILTGNSKLFVQDVLKHGSLMKYRRYQQTISAINDHWKYSPTGEKSAVSVKIPSQTVALYAVTGLALVRSAFSAMNACSEPRNNSSCLLATSSLAVSALQIPASYLAAKYVPWIVDRFSVTALELLPSRAPAFVRENLQLMRTTAGLRIAGRAVGIAIGLPGLGFELYTLVQLSTMIEHCSQEDSNCTSKDRFESIIMLTFSCTSLIVGVFMLMATGVGIWIGVAVGLAIEIFQSISLGINDVIYYHQRYGTRFEENIRLFASRVGFIPMLRDVEDLARDTEWMNLLQEKATNFLEAIGTLVVGYAVGVGRTVQDGVIASASSIDLNAESKENTERLSRVLPSPKYITQFMCLPRQKHFTLYSDANYTPSLRGFFTQTAVHRCRNAFAEYRREAEQNSSSESAVVYDMALINRGEIIASNQYNNVFLIHGGAATVTGSINTTNLYKLMSDTFQGGIVFQGQSKNTLDLSALALPNITFSWNVQWKMGSIRLNNSQENSFTVMTKNSHFLKLHVIGRAEKTEIYTCNNSKKHGTTTSANFIIDGRGGTVSKMDCVRDCKVTIIRPYTYVAGGNDRNATHLAHVPLRYAAPALSSTVVERKSVIDPRQSKFIVTFTDRPLLGATHKIKYIPTSATLSWEFSDTPLSTLILQVKTYRTPYLNVNSDTSEAELDMSMINCMFVDAFTNSIIYPKLNLLGNETDTVPVQNLNVLTWINSTRWADVVSHYRKIKTDVSGMFIVYKLIDSLSGKSFSFGSRTGDRFYVDANTTVIYGGDGSDVYSFNSLSSESVWLDNRARDTATDTIVMSDGMCSSLVVDIGSDDTQDFRGSVDDITLTCLTAPSAALPRRKVVLRDYRLDASSRHLQIYWKDSLYVPVIYNQPEQFYVGDSSSVTLALAFSFDDWSGTMLTPTREDSCIVVRMSDDVTNPLVAYRSQSNMILTRKYLDNLSPSFIFFEDFFSHNGSISHWSNLTVFVVDDGFDAMDRVSVLYARDLQSLLVDTENSEMGHFIQEYSVDMTINNKTVIINHNNESTVYKKLGILRLFNVAPEDVKAMWSATTASVQLCAQNSCVEMRNWCNSSSHRLYRIDFEVSLDRPPIVIRSLDKLQCLGAKNSSNQDTLIGELNEMLENAQRVLQLSEENEETDQSRLIKCLGINFAKTVDKSSMHELFGFATEFEEMSFVHSNCQAQYLSDILDQLSLKTFKNTLGIKIKKYLVSKPTNGMQSVIENFRSHLESLNDILWKTYPTAVHAP